MGYAYGQVCYETAYQAAQSVCAAEYPISSGTSVISCTSASSGMSSPLLNLRNATSSTTWTNSSVAVSFPVCDWNTFVSSPLSLNVEDGFLLSSAIVGLWILAWSFRVLRSVLRDSDSGSD